MTDHAAHHELRLERTYDAPREVVFAAWTEPDQLTHWWGPDGFDHPRDKIEVDLRVGGRFNVVMVVAAPEIAEGMGVPLGTEFPDFSVIAELRIPELLVLHSDAQPDFDIPVPITSRIEFHAEGERTRVVVQSGPYTDGMAPNAELGWTQQLVKLDTLLA